MIAGIPKWVLLAVPSLCALFFPHCAMAQKVDADNSGLYVKIKLDHPVKTAKLRPGDVIQGVLTQDVYSADHEIFVAGARARVSVDHMEKRRRIRNDHWPWVIKAFTPRHELFPVFKTASVLAPGGEDSLQVSLISFAQMRAVHAPSKKTSELAAGGMGTTGQPDKAPHVTPTMILEAHENVAHTFSGEEGKEKEQSAFDVSSVREIPAGTACKVLLLDEVSASESKAGDVFRARLLEPVSINDRIVLPAGSMFGGKVLKRTPPRWGSRAGSLLLTFTDITLPGGNRLPVTASLTAAEMDQRSHTRIDAEGKLHGEHPGTAWMAINIGVTAGLAKEVDDGTQLIIEAIVSTATDASTAGTARIGASIVSTIFMVTRHGRDVILPRFTELQIGLDRPLTISQPE
jgi:hypothetical protein